MKKTFLFAYFILLSECLHAQTNSDSLLRIVQQGRADTAHVMALLGLAKFELEAPEPTRNLGKALQYEQQAIALARKIGFVQGQGRALLWENDYFELLGRSAEQTKRLEAAVDLFMSIKDFKQVTECYEKLAEIERKQHNRSTAKGYYQKILQIKPTLIKHKIYDPVYMAYYQIGRYYQKVLQIDSSNVYLKTAIDFSIQYDTKFWQAYVNYAYNALDADDYAKAIIALKQLLERAKVKKDAQAEMWGWSTLGSIYANLGSSSKAIDAYAQAEKCAAGVSENKQRSYHLAKLLVEVGLSPSKDKIDSLIALQKVIHKTDPCDFAYGELGVIYPLLGDLKGALHFYDELILQARNCQDTFYIVQGITRKANILMRLNRYQESRPLALHAYKMAQASGEPFLINEIEFVLSRQEAYYGNTARAEMLYQKANSYQDSAYQKKIEGMGKLAEQIEQEASHVVILERENQLLVAEMENRKLFIILLALGVIILIGLLINRQKVLRQTRKLTLEINQQLDDLGSHLNTSMEDLSDGLQEQIKLQSEGLKGIQKKLAGSGMQQGPKEKIQGLRSILEQQTNLSQMIRNSAAQKESQLRSFNYTVGHDLKSPLNNVHNFLELLALQPALQADEDSLHLLEKAKEANQVSKEMINGISEYADADNLPIQYEMIDTAQLLHSILKRMTIPASYSIIVSSDLPLLHADVFLMRQVFTNLISNAVKFTAKREKPEIIISGASDDTGTSIEVQDNGTGIPPASLPHIFTLFKSAHNRAEFEGQGIGLAIVKRIVERHRGRVNVRNNFGQGCVFAVQLPLKHRAIDTVKL